MRERMRYLRRPRRARWRRWADRVDLYHPRPIDYVMIAAAFLVLSLLWIGERTYAVQLNRRVFQLEEKQLGLRQTGATLAARVNALAERGRVVERAERDLGMVVPKPGAFQVIAYVPRRGVPMPTHRGRPTVLAGFPSLADGRGR
jgi:hypothetical protein